MNRQSVLTCLIFSISIWRCSDSVQAQVPAQRFDLRDLGVPFVDAIPADENAITSLIVGPEGKIYGGTTGSSCHLFVFSPTTNRVKPLGSIAEHQSIHNALAAGLDGMIYLGTGLNEEKQYPISPPPPGHGGIVISLWNDIENRYRQYQGGHLYRYDPREESRVRTEIGQSANLKDLGLPAANNGIYALIASPKRAEIYGLTYPQGHFFVYDISSGKLAGKGELYKEKVYGGPNRSLRSISGALVCDNKGNVYGSGDSHFLFEYDAESGEILYLKAQIPHLYIGAVEALVKDVKGWIYGGTSEGFLFKFDPETHAVINLGKPIGRMRIRGLTVGLDGRIYGIAGEQSAECHFFCYDPKVGGYTIFGSISVERHPYYDWLGKQFDAIAAGLDGTIYLGESERKSHLFLFSPIP